MGLQFIRSVIIVIFIVVIISKGQVVCMDWPRLGEHHDDDHPHHHQQRSKVVCMDGPRLGEHYDDDHHHHDHHYQQHQQRSRVVCMHGPRLGGQRDGWEGSVKTHACAMPVTIVIFIIFIVVNVSENCSSPFTIIMINHVRTSIKWTPPNITPFDHPSL